jgi:unconventional prefoldin RPB5 interactor 1
MAESPGLLGQQLEAKISKLKDALYYWKTWEAEYEGLKEELEEQDEPTAQEMVSGTES